MFAFRGDKFSYKNFFKSKKGLRSTDIFIKPFSNMLTDKECILTNANINNILNRK